MAPIIEQPPLDVEHVVLMLSFAVVLTTLTVVLVALMRTGFGAARRSIRHRRSLLAQGESMFVARWGREGPELFVVGFGARPLPVPRTGRTSLARRELGGVGLALAERILFEILARRPSRELASSFAEERLGTLPADGFVLPTSEVITWLDAREAGADRFGRRIAELAAAGTALVASAVRPATRAMTEDPLPPSAEPLKAPAAGSARGRRPPPATELH